MDKIRVNRFNFEVVDNTKLGRACISTKSILKGEILCKMDGSPISYKQFCEKYGYDCDDLLQVGKEEYIELMKPFIFFNHSCDPNAGLRNMGILFALKDISEGEEICYDYSTTADDSLWQMDCNCDSSLCRKTIGDFLSLPHDRKEFFLKNNALMDYIIDVYY